MEQEKENVVEIPVSEAEIPDTQEIAASVQAEDDVSSIVGDKNTTDTNEAPSSEPKTKVTPTQISLPKLLPKKPLTAYFLFAKERRQQMQEEFQGASVGEIGKKIGQAWKAISSDEKQVYLDAAKAEREKYNQLKEALVASGDWDALQPASKSDDTITLSETVFPLARVKRIIQADPDVQKVSKEAAFAISKATEHFVQYFAKRCYQNSMSYKRKTILPTDIRTVVHASSEFEWLKPDIPQVSPTEPAKASRKRQLDTPALDEENGVRIKSFFQPVSKDQSSHPNDSRIRVPIPDEGPIDEATP